MITCVVWTSALVLVIDERNPTNVRPPSAGTLRQDVQAPYINNLRVIHVGVARVDRTAIAIEFVMTHRPGPSSFQTEQHRCRKPCDLHLQTGAQGSWSEVQLAFMVT